MTSQFERIDQFWQWFEAAQNEIVSAYRDQRHKWLAENITPRVRALKETQDPPRLNWEMGPGELRSWQFVISPTVLQNLPITESAVSRSPDLADWEWHAWKPPKTDNPFEIEILDESRKAIEVDATGWRFKLRSTGKRRIGVLFVAPSISGLDDACRRRAAYLVLDNLIGEKLVIEHFDEAALVQESQVPGNLATAPIASLKEEVRFVVNQSH